MPNSSKIPPMVPSPAGLYIIELTIVVATLAILNVMAISIYMDNKQRSYIAEALTFSGLLKGEMVASRTTTGRWLSNGSDVLKAMGEFKYIHDTEMHGAAFTFEINFGHTGTGRLTFRAAEPILAPTAPIIWLCGYALAPPGYAVPEQNKTSIPAKLLPRPCRKGEI